MKNINILIIEDTVTEANTLKKHLETLNFNIVAIASSLKDALGIYFAEDIDLVIIDVFLNGAPDGIVFAEKVNEQTKKTKPFVFLTSHMDRAIFERAKITQPYSFLLKPFRKHEIAYTIELALEKYMAEKEQFYNFTDQKDNYTEFSFFVKKNHAFFKVPLSDVYYIEVEGRYSKIVTEENSFLIQSALTELHKKLPQDQFLRTHRNFLVNKEQVKEVHPSDNLIILNNNMEVLLARSYKESFFSSYKIFK